MQSDTPRLQRDHFRYFLFQVTMSTPDIEICHLYASLYKPVGYNQKEESTPL